MSINLAINLSLEHKMISDYYKKQSKNKKIEIKTLKEGVILLDHESRSAAKIKWNDVPKTLCKQHLKYLVD